MTISVVIPTLNEADWIAETIGSLCDESRRSESRGVGGAAGRALEILVVDGGSQDETGHAAAAAGATVLSVGPAEKESERGRARQLRLGAMRAKGDVILFLHADTRLEPGWVSELEAALEDPACAGGAFKFRFRERGVRERWIEGGVALRVALFRLPYGDQALFMRRGVLEAMGGVPRVPILEDLDLVAAIKRAGRLTILDRVATTSSRRYRDRGTLQTLLGHQWALLGWALGWDRASIARRLGR